MGTSFWRFLEIAKYLDFTIKVVTDNDGDVKALEKNTRIILIKIRKIILKFVMMKTYMKVL